MQEGRNIQSILATEVVRRRMRSSKHTKYEWMREHEVYERFPARVAAALIRELSKSQKTEREHPQLPGGKANHQIKVMTCSGVDEDEIHDHKQELKTMMSIDAGDTSAAQGLAADCQQWAPRLCSASASGSLGTGTPPAAYTGTPEEQAEVNAEEEVARKKADK